MTMCSLNASHLVKNFLAKHKITQVTQLPTVQIWCPMTSGFSQNWNHHWKRRDIRPLMRFRKIQRDSWWRWENCVRSPGAYFEGDWGVIVLCTMFLISCIFNKCLSFSYYMAAYLLDRLHMSQLCIFCHYEKRYREHGTTPIFYRFEYFQGMGF